EGPTWSCLSALASPCERTTSRLADAVKRSPVSAVGDSQQLGDARQLHPWPAARPACRTLMLVDHLPVVVGDKLRLPLHQPLGDRLGMVLGEVGELGTAEIGDQRVDSFLRVALVAPITPVGPR